LVPSPEAGPCEDLPVVPADIHDLFAASAGVAGALIGLLFVAISVAGERLAATEAAGQVHRIRARAALIAFLNALSVSLFALVPGEKIGYASVSVAIIGLLFVAASLLSLVRLRQVRWTTVRDALFLVGLVVTFIYQLTSGIDLVTRPGDSGTVNTLGILVICCFIIGISRAWELIGGPSIGFAHEVVALARSGIPVAGGPSTADSGPREPAAGDTGTGDTGTGDTEAPDAPPA
jgi:hypothetical protein